MVISQVGLVVRRSEVFVPQSHNQRLSSRVCSDLL